MLSSISLSLRSWIASISITRRFIQASISSFFRALFLRSLAERSRFMPGR